MQKQLYIKIVLGWIVFDRHNLIMSEFFKFVDLLQNNLYNTVKDKYHIDTVTHTRAEFYKILVKDNKKEVKQLIEETNAI